MLARKRKNAQTSDNNGQLRIANATTGGSRLGQKRIVDQLLDYSSDRDEVASKWNEAASKWDEAASIAARQHPRGMKWPHFARLARYEASSQKNKATKSVITLQAGMRQHQNGMR